MYFNLKHVNVLMYSKRPHACTYKYNQYFQLKSLVSKQVINHHGDF